MSGIEEKYQELLHQGWVPAVPLPVVPLPAPGTHGRFFGYVLSNGVAVTIYEHPDTGTFEVHGAILARYLELGGPLALGFPVSDEVDDVVGGQPVGRVSHFQYGSIFYHHGTLVELRALSAPGTAFEVVDGIDVSYAQGTIDWSAVGQAGLGFAYIKATEGDNHTDNQFAHNWAGSAGHLPRGAYHYFHARTTPDATRAQADHFTNVLTAAGGGAELPPAVDVETLPHGVTAEQAVVSLQFFISIVWQATGQRPLIYTYPSFWTSQMRGNATFDGKHHLWIASYGRPLGHGAHATRPNGPLLPRGWSDYSVWQHAIGAGIPGIAGLVDRNMVAVPGGQSVVDFLH
ncbi:GH25 family lysozyme [Plantactinospora sp. CA-294935]|uniref:GH25 family lysozyme n=1 Tax=Plantactinospora sp. CA-294935 TaxID=3240012 RepID=UPI003D8AACD0